MEIVIKILDDFYSIFRLVHMVVYGSKLKLYELTSSEQNVVQADFVEV